MKKRNVFLQTAIASALVAMSYGANAGTLSGTANYATELFGTGSSVTNITSPSLVYTFSTPGGIVINPSGTIFAYVRLNNSTFAADPTTGSFSFGGGITQLNVTAVAVSTDKTTARVSISNSTAGGNVVIGVGGTLTLAAPSIAGASTVLNTVNGALTANYTIGTTSAAAFEAGSTLPADLDGGLSNTLSFAVAKEAITGAVTSAAAYTTAETAKVDLTATNPGSVFTTPVNGAIRLLNVGAVKFSNVTGVKDATGTADYTVVGKATATALGGTVTGTFKTGTTGLLTTDIGCTTAIAAGSAGSLNAGLTTLTFTGGTRAASGTDTYICLVAPTTTTAIPVTSLTGAFTLAKTAATEVADTASGALYTLANNGQTATVRSYIPAGTTGYTSFVRVINTGGVAAVVTGQFVYQDGTTSTATAIAPTTPIAAGGAVTWTAAQIESFIGAPTATIGSNRPRLVLTAPTNGLQVQSFFLNPDNSFSIMHGTD